MQVWIEFLLPAVSSSRTQAAGELDAAVGLLGEQTRGTAAESCGLVLESWGRPPPSSWRRHGGRLYRIFARCARETHVGLCLLGGRGTHDQFEELLCGEVESIS